MFGSKTKWIAAAPGSGKTHAPLFRYQFNLAPSVTSAMLYISGLGYYGYILAIESI